MEPVKEFALRCLTMLARWLCPGAEDDHAAIARRIGMEPEGEVDHDNHLARWIEDEDAAIAQREEADRDSLQAFTLRLNKRLADGAGRSGNLVFSPLCLYVALSLWAAGARERTLDELLGVLGAPSWDVLTGHVCTLAEQAIADRPPIGGPHVSFTCSLWHDTTVPLCRAYRDVAAEWYKAVVRPVNFHQKPEEAREQINAWVAALTNDLIPSMIGRDALSHSHLTGRPGAPAALRATEHCRPLPARPQSAPIFLPDARDGLWRLASQIACVPDFLRKHLPRSDVEVDDFRLPTFKVSFDMTMNGILRDMGLNEDFEPGKAGLSDMAEDGGKHWGRWSIGPSWR